MATCTHRSLSTGERCQNTPVVDEDLCWTHGGGTAISRARRERRRGSGSHLDHVDSFEDLFANLVDTARANLARSMMLHAWATDPTDTRQLIGSDFDRTNPNHVATLAKEVEWCRRQVQEDEARQRRFTEACEQLDGEQQPAGNHPCT